MKKQLLRPARFICAALAASAVLLCGLTGCGNTKDPPETQQSVLEPVSSAPAPQDSVNELYPAEVQTVMEGDGRQIIKTYRLADGESPANIPRGSFESDGWLFKLADVTKNNTGGTDTRPHVETVGIETESDDLAEIMEQLSPELEYESEDGYCGVLALDLTSVQCEAAGYENSSYTVTETREYLNLPVNNLAYIPKTVTENGRTLALDSVEWAAQSSVNVGYTDIPDSYRAVARYVGTALQSVATGYITTAEYAGEITKEIAGEIIYTAYFSGSEIRAVPLEIQQGDASTPVPTPVPAPATAAEDNAAIPAVPIISAAIAVVLLVGAAAFLFLRHNVKVYNVGEDGNRILTAKVRISAKNHEINLTPLGEHSENRVFILVIEKMTAKRLNGIKIDVVFALLVLHHTIAYEGNAYTIEANFRDATIKAIY